MELVQMDLVINIITNILKKISPYYFPYWIRIQERKWKRIRIHGPDFRNISFLHYTGIIPHSQSFNQYITSAV